MFLPINFAIRNYILVFGYGNVGKRKADFLAKLGFTVKVIDASPLGSLPENITGQQAFLSEENIVDFLQAKPDLVIVALGDTTISAKIAEYCRITGIPVNVVDVPAISTVIFSSIVKSRSLWVSISTQGKCPFYAKQLRKELSPLIEKKAENLDVLAILRKEAANPKKDLRRVFRDQEFQKYLSGADYTSALKIGRKILSKV